MRYTSDCDEPEIVVTGCGIISSIGQGKLDFTEALIEGMHAFDYMKRPGRQFDSRYIGAEISEIACPENMPLKIFNKISLLVKAAVTVLKEVWDEARLKEVDPNRIGLIIGAFLLSNK